MNTKYCCHTFFDASRRVNLLPLLVVADFVDVDDDDDDDDDDDVVATMDDDERESTASRSSLSTATPNTGTPLRALSSSSSVCSSRLFAIVITKLQLRRCNKCMYLQCFYVDCVQRWHWRAELLFAQLYTQCYLE